MDISTLKNNSYCSERVSPRRLRANKILPPECHYVLQSYCTQRISPRRQRNGCEEFVEDVLLSNVKTSSTDPSSPILGPSSFPSQIIQKEETSEIQEVFEDQRVSASQGVSALHGIYDDQGVHVPQSNDQSSSENQEVFDDQRVYDPQSNDQLSSEIQEVFDDQEEIYDETPEIYDETPEIYVSQSNDQSSSENISESSQDESPEPSSSSSIKIKNEDPLKSPLSSQDRVDYTEVVLSRMSAVENEMIKIVNTKPHVPQREIAIDIHDITVRFIRIIENGSFDESDQKYLLKCLKYLAKSATEVLRKNIDIKEIKEKTIEAYEDAAILVQKIVENDPHYGSISIEITGDLQEVLDKASQISNDLKKVTRNVVPTQTTSTGSGTVSVVADETDETSGTTAEDIEKMIEAIFNAFNTLVDRSQNKNE